MSERTARKVSRRRLMAAPLGAVGKAVADRNLVTSRGWPDRPYFMPQFLRVLAGR